VIGSLRGTILDKGVDSLVLEVGGVGYAMLVSLFASKALPPVGAETRVFVHTHATTDGPWQLFGFVDADERRVFQALISVQGVGPKAAIALLSGLALPDLVRAISGGDLARLTQIRGVGRKTAERLALELRDTIGATAAGSPRGAGGAGAPAPGSDAPSGRLGEVWAALVALGYRPPEFEAQLARMDAALPAAELVKQALAALRRK
jgi:Holliday junction DNA helicase RuvA